MHFVTLTPPTNKEPIKIARILCYLYHGSTLNRFEASYLLHDTCLNSTISVIRNDFGIVVNGQSEKVLGYQKLQTICQRYSLSNSTENLTKAYNVLVEYFGYIPDLNSVA